MKKDIALEQQIVDRISALIKSEYLDGALLCLKQNKGDKDSLNITVDNNPWRNGVINGDMLFGRIKTGGKIQYLQVKNKYSHFFKQMGVPYEAKKTDEDNDMIRINLSDFCSLLDAPTELLTHTINTMYIDNIAFAGFGCCSKYAECEIQGMCLHTDQLYATACQWQKHLKRSDRFDSPKEESTG